MESFNVTVNTPAGVCIVTVTKTTKVQDIIDQIVVEKGLAQADKLELYYNGEPLKPTTRPLVSFGVTANATLTLVAAGTGV